MIQVSIFIISKHNRTFGSPIQKHHKTQNISCRRSFRLHSQSDMTPCRSTSCIPRFFLYFVDDLFDDTLQTFFEDTLQTIHPADLFSYILQTINVLCADDPGYELHRRYRKDYTVICRMSVEINGKTSAHNIINYV